MSSRILRRRPGDISLPLWSGTVVTRPSTCRNCLCEPRWRTSTKPSCSSAEMTCRGLNDGSLTTLTHLDQLCSNELGFDVRLAVFKKHFHNFLQIRMELIQTLSLRVCSRQTRDEANVETSVGIPLDHGSERPTHGRSLPRWRMTDPGEHRPRAFAMGGLRSSPASRTEQ